MALITCPECGHDVSTNALACPNCGSPPPEDAPSKDISPDIEQTPQTQNKQSHIEIKVTIITFLLLGGFIYFAWMQEQAENEKITANFNEKISTSFNANRESILQKMPTSIDVGAYDMALIYGERYESIGDEELNSLLTTARDRIHYGIAPNEANAQSITNSDDLRQARGFLSQLPPACKNSRMSTSSDGTVTIRISCKGSDKSMEGTVEIKDGIVRSIR